MSPSRSLFFVLAFAGVLWSCVLCLQRPPPRYSQQYMPETSFTCRNKIVGSYYADPETDCQLFHVCVSVAGSVQDYRFLCPNDTAFDQESQTCADWYDVDCEAATLYYASDNFDLYRIGSGLESLHFDSIRSDAEPQDHLQRSETSDAVRSSANVLNRVAATSFKDTSNKDILRGSSSSNYFNNRNNAKDDDYENDKTYDKTTQEPRKKSGVRKISRKQQYSGNNGNSYTSTSAPVTQTTANYNSNVNYYSDKTYNHNQRNFNTPTTTQRLSSAQDTFKNTQKYTNPTTTRPSSTLSYSTYTTTTYRPITNYPEGFTGFPIISSSTAKTTTTDSVTDNYNTGFGSSNFGQSSEATPRPSTFSSNKNFFNPSTFTGTFSQSTTIQPSTNYQSSDFGNFQRNYNNIQRTSSTGFPSSTNSPAFFDSFSSNAKNGQYKSRLNSPSSIRQEFTQTTKFFSNNYSGNSYQPTTYNPIAKNNDNSRGGDRYNSQSSSNDDGHYRKNENTRQSSNDDGQYRKSENNRQSSHDDGQYRKSESTRYPQTRDNGQYNEKSSQSKPTQYYDSTKIPKKATQYNSYDTGNTGKYYETSTANYDFGRSAGIGFSPSSINHLAETPRFTTPVPRRNGAPTTYNPNSYNANTQKPAQSQTTSRGTTFVSNSARPFSTTTKFADSTTVKPVKSGKKNDYDYAYYDNAGALEYDGLELEHVTGSKESSKISRT